MASWREPAKPRYEDQEIPDKNFIRGDIAEQHIGSFAGPRARPKRLYPKSEFTPWVHADPERYGGRKTEEEE